MQLIRNHLKDSLLIICASLFFSCSSFQDHIKSSPDILPGEYDVPGWKIVKKSSCPFDDFEVTDSACAEYKKIDEEKSVFVEILGYTSPFESYRAFGEKSGIDSVTDDPEICSISSGTGIFSRFGRNLVRIRHSAHATASDTEYFHKAISALAGSGGLSDLPPEFRFSSMFGRKTGLLVTRPAGDLSPLKFYLKLSGEINGKKRIFFYSFRKNQAEAESDFLAHVKKTGVISGTGTSGSSSMKESGGKIFFVRQYKRWIFGCIECDNISEARESAEFIKNKIDDFEKNLSESSKKK